MEFAHHPLSRAGTYNEVLGDSARRRVGPKKWRKRVLFSIETLRQLTMFDHCYIGGGNASRLGSDIPQGVTVVSNDAGILGGIKLWETNFSPGLFKASAPARRVVRKRSPVPPATDPHL
jgi:polyphosphate glucokinase